MVEKQLEQGALAYQKSYGKREGRHPEELLADQKNQLFFGGPIHHRLLSGLHKKGIISGYDQLQKKIAYLNGITEVNAPESVSFKIMLTSLDSNLRKMHLLKLDDSAIPQIRVRKDTVISISRDKKKRFLHLNTVLDFLRRPILIGQSPVDEGSVRDYWDAIWENRVSKFLFFWNIIVSKT